MVRKRPSFSDYAEAAGTILVFGFFRMLPLDWASAVGGAIARVIGPRLGISKRARENLRLAMPELAPDAAQRVLRGMWDNLGRVAAEYAHLRKFRLFEPDGRIEFVDRGNVLSGRRPGQRYIFFSAHCANWEIAIRGAIQAGFDVTAVYRAANNPLIDQFIAWTRGADGGEFVPKGTVAATRARAALREGRELCMLIDQKMNDGIAVPFFGRPAMTAPALALLALRFKCMIVPVHVTRLDGARFRIVLEPPLDLPHSGHITTDQFILMTEVNRIVEAWVREAPAQWLWLHRRWPD